MYSYYSEILVHIKKAKIWSLFTALYPRTSRLAGNFYFFLSVLMIHNTRTVNISMVTFKTLHQIDAQPPVKELTFIQLVKVAAQRPYYKSYETDLISFKFGCHFFILTQWNPQTMR